MNKGCEFYADALIERAADLLDEGRAAQLDTHMATCEECTDTLRAIRALRAAPLEVPVGLEARVRSAVREAAGASSAPAETMAATTGRHARPSASARWRPWALPLAAAGAAVGIWIGVGTPGTGPTDFDEPSLAALDDYEIFGAWPADGVIVAGDPLLGELSLEELEILLREMES
jgi:anti-sigma factor RsiW